MRSNRKKRLDVMVQEVLGELLLTRAGDARLSLVTITAVQVSPELDVAKVHFSVLGGPERREEVVRALRHAAPFLRGEVARRVRMRRMPELRFVPDESMERGRHMDAVLRDVAAERAEREGDGDVGHAEPPGREEDTGAE